jgi:hypothetical protein
MRPDSQTNECSPEPKRGHVPQKCNELDQAIQEMRIAALNLRDKVEPALMPYDPGPTAPCGMESDRPAMSTVAGTLHDSIENVRQIVRIIEELDARVDV